MPTTASSPQARSVPSELVPLPSTTASASGHRKIPHTAPTTAEQLQSSHENFPLDPLKNSFFPVHYEFSICHLQKSWGVLSWLQNHNLLLQMLVAGDGFVPLWSFWSHLASCTCRVTRWMWASLALLESGPTGLITEHSFHKIRYQDIIFKVSLAFAPQVQTRDCFLSAGPCATHGTGCQ